MTPRENAMAVYNREQPDYYGDLMDAIVLLPDPVLMRDIPPQDGKIHPDSWGVPYVWKPGAPGAHPYITPDNVVIKDIENWDRYVKVPSLENLDWGPAQKVAEGVDRKEKFVGIMFGGGLFERSHFLLGMENALMDYLEYPDEMKELLSVIKDFKIAYIRQMAEKVHPDIIFYHDDWGSKQNVFLPPAVMNLTTAHEGMTMAAESFRHKKSSVRNHRGTGLFSFGNKPFCFQRFSLPG